MPNYELLISQTVVLRDLYERCLYPEAYRYLALLASRRPLAGGGGDRGSSAAWLRCAAGINQNDGTLASEYQRRAVTQVAALLGRNISPQQFQRASNALAARIIGHALHHRHIPPPEQLETIHARNLQQQLLIPRWAWVDVIGDVVAGIMQGGGASRGGLGSIKAWTDALIDATLPAGPGTDCIYASVRARLLASFERAAATPSPPQAQSDDAGVQSFGAEAAARLRDRDANWRGAAAWSAPCDGVMIWRKADGAEETARPSRLDTHALFDKFGLDGERVPVSPPSVQPASSRATPEQAARAPDHAAAGQRAPARGFTYEAMNYSTAVRPSEERRHAVREARTAYIIGKRPPPPDLALLSAEDEPQTGQDATAGAPADQTAAASPEPESRPTPPARGTSDAQADAPAETSRFIDHAIAALPDLPPLGTIPSLHQAMARDRDGHLQALVRRFADAGAPAERHRLMHEIVYRWAGVCGIAPHSRSARKVYGNAIGDARKLAVLEAALAMPYAGLWLHPSDARPTRRKADPNPHGRAAPVLLAAFAELEAFVYHLLMAQTHYRPLLHSVQLPVIEGQLVCDARALRSRLRRWHEHDAIAAAVEFAELADMLEATGGFSRHLRAALASASAFSLFEAPQSPELLALLSRATDGASAFDSALRSALGQPR